MLCMAGDTANSMGSTAQFIYQTYCLVESTKKSIFQTELEEFVEESHTTLRFEHLLLSQIHRNAVFSVSLAGDNGKQLILFQLNHGNRPWTEASAGVTDRDLACTQFRRN